MKFLHSMIRVRDLDASLRFFRDGLGLVETRRKDVPKGRFTLVYLAAPENPDTEIELTYNYDDEDYGSARNFESPRETRRLIGVSHVSVAHRDC